MRFSGGIMSVGVSCIILAVSALRMRLPLYSPFCRCAIMNLAMSSPLAARLPAGGELVALGHVWGERLGQRLAKRRMRHAEGLEDVSVQVVIERLPRDMLDQVAGEGGRIVGVGGGGARLEDACRR